MYGAFPFTLFVYNAILVDHEKIRLATKIEEMVSIYSKLVKMNKKVTDVADRIPVKYHSSYRKTSK